jgi:hypothetical protein
MVCKGLDCRGQVRCEGIFPSRKWLSYSDLERRSDWKHLKDCGLQEAETERERETRRGRGSLI